MEANKQEGPRKLEEGDISLLKEASTVPLPKLSNTTPMKQPIKGFVKPTQGLTEHGSLPNQRTKEGFDPNAYKLLARAGYDFGSSSEEGSSDITSQKVHELDESQKRLRRCTIDPARSGLGFVQSEPIKISGRRKDRKANTQHISVEVLEEDGESQSTTMPEHVGGSTPRVSVFDRVDISTSLTSAFNRIPTTINRTSVFNRLSSSNEIEEKVNLAPRKSVFERIQAPMERQRRKRKGQESQNDGREIRSLVPSRMKRHSTLEVSTNGQLKVKQHTIIFTGQADSDEEEIVRSAYHVTIEEVDDPEALEGDSFDSFEDELEEAPSAFEDGGQATVDKLKELNLGTEEEPNPVFVSALLSSEEEKEYHELLLEYKDVFAWTYKEMPGLDPKVAVHRLAVKPEARPIKQTQRRFRTELLS